MSDWELEDDALTARLMAGRLDEASCGDSYSTEEVDRLRSLVSESVDYVRAYRDLLEAQLKARAAPPSKNVQQPYVQPTSLILLAQLDTEIASPSGDVNLRHLVGRIREEVIAEAAASRGDVGGQPVAWMVERKDSSGTRWVPDWFDSDEFGAKQACGSGDRVVPLYLAPTEPEVDPE